MTTEALIATSRRPRRCQLVGHLIVSVGLLGDSAGFLAVAVRSATSDSASFQQAAGDLLTMFSLLFGIPLSFLSLITGVLLAWRGGWRLLEASWVTAKLVLIVSVIGVGALVLSPALDARPGTADGRLIVAAAWDVAALATATALGVIRPRRDRARPASAPSGS